MFRRPMSGLGQAGCPSGYVGMPPYCYPTSGQPADPSAACPPGQCGWPPYCYPCEPGAPVPSGPVTPPTTEQCPPGTYGMPPYCYGMPGEAPAPETPDPTGETCPPGTYGMPPYCYGIPGQMPPGVPGVPEPPAPGVPEPQPPAPGPAPSVPGAPGPAPAPTPPGIEPVQPSWWEQRSDTEKAVIIGAAGIAGVLLVAGFMGKKKKRGGAMATANRRRRTRRARARRRGRRTKRNIRRVRCKSNARRKAAPSLPAFKPAAWTERRRSKLKCAGDKRIGNCHCKAPLKYAREGASRPSDYAYPKCFQFPLYFNSADKSRRHIRNAAARFAQNMHRYPPDVQRVMYRNIMKAKKAYGIGEFRGVKPPKVRKRRKPTRRRYRRAA